MNGSHTWALALLGMAACSAPNAASVRPPTGSPTSAASGAEAAASEQGGIPLAITIDDLPFAGPEPREGTTAEALGDIASELTQRGVPATGFVVCERMTGQGEAVLAWKDAGLEIGNHSTTHRSVDRMPLGEWIEDVEACRDRLSRLTGSAPRFFRYPMLQTGKTRELRDEAAAALRELGHERAPVSIDTAEYVLAAPYAEALARGDEARAGKIAESYVQHLRLAARHYRRLARERAGREVAQVLLLHANVLAADHLGEVLDMLRDEGFRFVSLADALRDPVYARVDDWASPVGSSWLLRIAPAWTAGWAWDRAQQRALEVRFGIRPESEMAIGPDLRAIPVVGAPAWVVTHDEPIPSNSLVYLTDEGVPVLADAPFTPAATRDLLDWISVRFGQKPGFATVSHYHFDASAGIGPLQEASVPVAVSDHTAKLLRQRGAGMQDELVSMFGDAFRDWVPAAPIETFSEAAGVRTTVGGTEIEVFFPGHAHAPDNVVTYFPTSGLLFGGCMVKGGKNLGYTGVASLEHWPSAIAKLMSLDPKIVIPGHGPRMDAALLAHTKDLLDKHAEDEKR